MTSDRIALFTVSLAVLLCPSCKKNKMRNDMNRFYSQTVSFPASMPCFEGEKIKFLDLKDNRSKIVIWYDSSECSSCRINNLPVFKEFESYCQNLQYSFDIVFLFSPSHKSLVEVLEEASYSTKLHDYPIFIDTANQFYKLNPHIPDNKLMHSFLLDSEGKVVLVGNPIQNQAMFDLYKKTIEEMIN